MDVLNQPLNTKSLLTMPSNVLTLRLKQTFPSIILIFTEGDEIESRLPVRIFSTLSHTRAAIAILKFTGQTFYNYLLH